MPRCRYKAHKRHQRFCGRQSNAPRYSRFPGWWQHGPVNRTSGMLHLAPAVSATPYRCLMHCQWSIEPGPALQPPTGELHLISARLVVKQSRLPDALRSTPSVTALIHGAATPSPDGQGLRPPSERHSHSQGGATGNSLAGRSASSSGTAYQTVSTYFKIRYELFIEICLDVTLGNSAGHPRLRCPRIQ